MNNSDEGSDGEVLMRNPRSDDPRMWKADDGLEMFMEPVDAEDEGNDGRWEGGVVTCGYPHCWLSESPECFHRVIRAQD